MDTHTIRFIAQNLVFLFATPCIITYLLFAWDKHLAHYKRRRVPEALLFLMCLLFGAFGGLCGMVFFRHKTKHLSFLIIVPLLAILQIAAVVLFKLYVQK
jgi:uncharacterized membrane protein YsdA (DUF1294 family)